MIRKGFPIVLIILFSSFTFAQSLKPTSNSSSWFKLSKQDLRAGEHHKRHSDIFGKSVDGYNAYILKAVDLVQAKAMDGGGYFAQLKADPPESPTGYSLTLFGTKLIEPARTTSYCSGSTYTVFVEAMNMIFPNGKLEDEKSELMRMQEPDGGRRDDHVKMWGEWNADGFGNQFALVQYSQMGKRVKPEEAKPGDFMNISWKNGGGHSVIFLGWYTDDEGKKNVVYWSSQKSSNGFGDQVIPLERIENVCVVRLTDPEKIFSFTPPQKLFYGVKGDKIDW